MDKALKICLLITDDPDDHQSFLHALEELDKNTILLVVVDPRHARSLILSRKVHPDYIFADVSMHGFKVNEITSALNSSDGLSTVPLIFYGYEDDADAVRLISKNPFFNKDLSFKELTQFLNHVLAVN